MVMLGWVALTVAGCGAASAVAPAVAIELTPLPTATPPPTPDPFAPTPLPTRTWAANDPLPYTTQSGDWLPALAARFAVSAETIVAQNPTLVMSEAGLLDPGQRLTIPAQYLVVNSIAGSPLRLLPDSEFVYGPSTVDWNTAAFLAEQGGWLATHVETADGALRPAAEIIDRTAVRYSVHPRLLLALIEHQSGVVTGGQTDSDAQTYPLGYRSVLHTGLHRQLLWTVAILNRGYYGWREGRLVDVELADARVTRFDPWLNAGSVGVQVFFAEQLGQADFRAAVGPEGFLATYIRLFGDPFQYEVTQFPAGTQQPELWLPFRENVLWSYTGGPHSAWGNERPWSAVDFAPPAVMGGCAYSSEWVTAMADGVVARSGENTLMLDLDGDGNEATGWVVFYFHLSGDYVVAEGTALRAGEPVGHPSCEGGRATGTHVHVARKFNGEWIAADGMLPFMLSGWRVHSSGVPYRGRMTFALPAMEIEACECVSDNSLTR